MTISTALFFVAPALAQDKFAVYTNSMLKQEYSIKIESKEAEQFTLYVDAYPLDVEFTTGGFMLDEKTLDGFITTLNRVKAKYVEWVGVAKSNNVTDLRKFMTLEQQTVGSYFYYGSTRKFDLSVESTFEFMILMREDKVQYLLVMRTEDLEASDDKDIHCDGFALSFTSEKEFNDFIALVSREQVKTFLAKPKVEDLFKD